MFLSLYTSRHSQAETQLATTDRQSVIQPVNVAGWLIDSQTRKAWSKQIVYRRGMIVKRSGGNRAAAWEYQMKALLPTYLLVCALDLRSLLRHWEETN